MGQPLLQPFDIEVLGPSGKCYLKYNPEMQSCMSSTQSTEGETSTPSRLRTFTERLLQLLGNGAAEDESDEEEPSA